MTTARIKSSQFLCLPLVSLLATLTIGGCKSAGNQSVTAPTTSSPDSTLYSKEYYYLDVVGDRELDTLCVETRIERIESMEDEDMVHAIRKIYIHSGGEKHLILSVAPYIELGHKSQNIPPIQSIHLETITPWTTDKALRIMLRNADLIPDCLWIEIHHDTEWRMTKLYRLNTLHSSEFEMYIKCVEVNRSLTEMFGEDRYCYPGDFVSEYFPYKP